MGREEQKRRDASNGPLVQGAGMAEDYYHRACVLGERVDLDALFQAALTIVPFEISIGGTLTAVSDPDLKRGLWHAVYGPVTEEAVCRVLGDTFRRNPSLMTGQYLEQLIPPELRREIFSYIGRGMRHIDAYARLLLLSLVYTGLEKNLAVVTLNDDNALTLSFAEGTINIFPYKFHEEECGWYVLATLDDEKEISSLAELGMDERDVAKLQWLEQHRLLGHGLAYIVPHSKVLTLVKEATTLPSLRSPPQLQWVAASGLINFLQDHNVDGTGLYEDYFGTVTVPYPAFVSWSRRTQGIDDIMANSTALIEPAYWCDNAQWETAQ